LIAVVFANCTAIARQYRTAQVLSIENILATQTGARLTSAA
jgi:hypothetical protein